MFPAACRRTLTALFLSLSFHISRKRPADILLDFLTHASATIVVFLNELSAALAACPNTEAAEAIEAYLELKPESSLANIMDKHQQERKLALVAEDILQSYLDFKTYNCEPARVFLKEILAKVVLEMTIQRCSRPEFINDWIVYLLEDGEPELMNAIDQGMDALNEQGTNESKGQAPKAVEVRHSRDYNERTTGDGGRATHNKGVGKAEQAMDEAMQEAQRLTKLMQDEDARRQAGQGEKGEHSPLNVLDDKSESTTQGIQTPSSSQSDLTTDKNTNLPQLASMDSRAREIETSETMTRQSAPTNTDQLVLGNGSTTALTDADKTRRDNLPSLTLFSATITVYDDALPGERANIRQKPTSDYMIQIEPASEKHSGWMTFRKYVDFETLHEVVRRISVISGVPFIEAHSTLPNWKVQTRAQLLSELERYLNDAVRYPQLAESEGMKRFLGKDQGLGISAGVGRGGFPGVGIGWPSPKAFEDMGKGMMDVMTKAPNQVAGGGNALFKGVTGAFGAVGSFGTPKKQTPLPTSSLSRVAPAGSPSPSSMDYNPPVLSPRRKSTDSLRGSPVIDQQPARVQMMERRPSEQSDLGENLSQPRPSISSRSSFQTRSSRPNSRPHSRTPSRSHTAASSPARAPAELYPLPPLPREIPDEHGSAGLASPKTSRQSQDMDDMDSIDYSITSDSFHTRISSPLPKPAPTPPLTRSPASRAPITSQQPKGELRPTGPKVKSSLSEQETRVAVDSMFATISSLYTLSSAWSLRRTLLTAAKTYLLRPGNPQLESIRLLMQDSIIESNTSDAGLAAHLRKLRENALPTEEELKSWPKEMSEEEKGKLRTKARKLLVERGMPMALTGVMGTAATGEALGRVFDVLQKEEVARGFMFGLLLQALRAVVQ